MKLDGVHELAAHYAAAIGPGGKKAWLASQLAMTVPALLDEVEQLRRAVMDEMAERDAARAEVERLRALLADDAQHVIEFRTDGWTIQHPLACRPSLFACPVNRAAEADLVEPPGLGRFECSTNDLGDRLLIGDRIESEVGDA